MMTIGRTGRPLLITWAIVGFWCCAAFAEFSAEERQNELIIRSEHYSLTFDEAKGGTITEIGGQTVDQSDSADGYLLCQDTHPEISIKQSPQQIDVTVTSYYMKDRQKGSSEIRAQYRYTFHAETPVVGCKAIITQNQVVAYTDVYVYPLWRELNILRFGEQSAFRGSFGGQRKDVHVFFRPGQQNMFDVSPQDSDAFVKLTLPKIARGEHLLAEDFKDKTRWTDAGGTWLLRGGGIQEVSQGGHWSWIVAGERDWDDYVVETSLLGTDTVDIVYLCARWLDADNHYEIEYIGVPAYCMRVNRVLGGRRVKLAEVGDMPHIKTPPQTRLALAVNGSRLRAYRNDELLIEVYDSTFRRGRIALGAATSGLPRPTTFFGVDVYALEEPDPDMPEIRLFQDVQRHAFYREEDQAGVTFLVESDRPLDEVTVSFELSQPLYPTHGTLLRQKLVVKELPAHKPREARFLLEPTYWRSGGYFLDVTATHGSTVLARDTTDLFLGRKPNPDRFTTSTWDQTSAEHLRQFGFNEVHIDAVDCESFWFNGKLESRLADPLWWQKPENRARLQYIYDQFDDCVREGMWGVLGSTYVDYIPSIRSSEGTPMPEARAIRCDLEPVREALALKRNGKELQDHRTGKVFTSGQPRANLWHPAVAKGLSEYYQEALAPYKDLPAWHAMHLQSESDRTMNVYGNSFWLAMARKELGFEVPEDVNNEWGPEGRPLPENGIVEDDDPYYRFYRWWWKRGAGYGHVHATVSDAVKTVRSDVRTVHDPALRQPFIVGQFAGIDMIRHWIYSWPLVESISLAADELRLCTVAGQETWLMLQLMTWGDCAIPRDSPNHWTCTEKRRGATYTEAHSPTTIREAAWLALSRGVGAMSFYNLKVVDPSQAPKKDDVRAGAVGSGYDWSIYTNPDTLFAIRDINLTVLQPYGMVTKRLSPPRAQVAFLLSNATSMLAMKDAENFRCVTAGPLYAKLQGAHVPVDVMYEETLEQKGLDGYEAIALPGCQVLPRHVYEKIKTFAKNGGLVIADQHLVAELPNVTRIPSDEKLRGWPAAPVQEKLLAGAKIVRELLDARITRWSDCDSPSVVLNELENGPNRLLFVINNLHCSGDYVGPWGTVLDDGVAQRTTVRIRRQDAVIYDALARRAVNPHAYGDWLAWDVDLDPGEGRIFVVMPMPIDRIGVEVPTEVKKGMSTKVTVTVRDAGGRPIAGLAPLQVTIKDSQGSTNDYSDYCVARNGEATLTLPIAKNEPSGDWTVTVRELYGGEKGGCFFKVARSQ
ncbi:MAG: hypothetical protein V2A58_06770 [Planctomycetota bacterium]